MTTRPYSHLPIETLERKWRELLDWADENDEDGGHIGFSRYYRESAYAILDEIKARRGENATPQNSRGESTRPR